MNENCLTCREVSWEDNFSADMPNRLCTTSQNKTKVYFLEYGIWLLRKDNVMYYKAYVSVLLIHGIILTKQFK